LEQKKKDRLTLVIIGAVAVAIFYFFNKPYEITYSYPVWSKDGKKIYFTKEVSYEKRFYLFSMFGAPIDKRDCYVMSMNADGSWKKVLASFKGDRDEFSYMCEFRGLKITPDGKELVFEVDSYGKAAYMIRKSEIYAVGVNGKNLRKAVSSEGRIGIIDFSISPDGKKIVYTKEDNIDGVNKPRTVWLIDYDGGNDHMICGENSHAAGWTIDGKAIISKFDELSMYDPLSGNVIREVKTYGYSGTEFDASMKSLNAIEKTNISPDGKKEVWEGDKGIVVKNLKTKKERLIIKGIKRP